MRFWEKENLRRYWLRNISQNTRQNSLFLLAVIVSPRKRTANRKNESESKYLNSREQHSLCQGTVMTQKSSKPLKILNDLFLLSLSLFFDLICLIINSCSPPSSSQQWAIKELHYFKLIFIKILLNNLISKILCL